MGEDDDPAAKVTPSSTEITWNHQLEEILGRRRKERITSCIKPHKGRGRRRGGRLLW